MNSTTKTSKAFTSSPWYLVISSSISTFSPFTLESLALLKTNFTETFPWLAFSGFINAQPHTQMLMGFSEISGKSRTDVKSHPSLREHKNPLSALFMFLPVSLAYMAMTVSLTSISINTFSAGSIVLMNYLRLLQGTLHFLRLKRHWMLRTVLWVQALIFWTSRLSVLLNSVPLISLVERRDLFFTSSFNLFADSSFCSSFLYSRDSSSAILASFTLFSCIILSFRLIASESGPSSSPSKSKQAFISFSWWFRSCMIADTLLNEGFSFSSTFSNYASTFSASDSIILFNICWQELSQTSSFEMNLMLIFLSLKCCALTSEMVVSKFNCLPLSVQGMITLEPSRQPLALNTSTILERLAAGLVQNSQTAYLMVILTKICSSAI